MNSDRIFMTTSQQLSDIFQNNPDLCSLAADVLQYQLTGFDLLRMSPRCILKLFGTPATPQLLLALQQLKQKRQKLNTSYAVYDGTVLDIQPQLVELCMPLHAPPVFCLEFKNLEYFPKDLKTDQLVQLLYIENEIIGLFEAEAYNANIISQAINFPAQFQEIELLTQHEKETQEKLKKFESLPFDSLVDEPIESQSNQYNQSLQNLKVVKNNSNLAQFQNMQQINMSPNQFSSTSAASVRLQPSFSGLSLTTKPSVVIPEVKFMTIRFRGRVEFLVEQIGAIVVPPFDCLENYQMHSTSELRDYKLGDGIGLLVGFCVGWYKSKNQDQIQRGDIVEFNLVPGYGFSQPDSFVNSADSPTYPFINAFETLKSQKVGQVQKKQQQFASEIQEFYANTNCDDLKMQLSCSADQLCVVDHLSKQMIQRDYLVQNNTYSGVVYSYSENDSYGFIKSYGSLGAAESFSQGFEVYFKLQKSTFVPMKGDYVTFKSHWVEDKAQAREVQFEQKITSQNLDGVCVGIYPPFIFIKCTSKDSQLQNNLFFTKYKQLPYAIKLTLRIGSKLQFKFDTDISTQFRAVFSSETRKSFSFSTGPGTAEVKDVVNPLNECCFICRLQPILFAKKKTFYLKSKMQMKSDVIVQISPYLMCQKEEQLPELIFSNGQLIIGQNLFYSSYIGVQTSLQGYFVELEGYSDEYCIFKEAESVVRIAIARGQVPVWVCSTEKDLILTWNQRQEEVVEEGTFLAPNEKDFLAAVIGGNIVFHV